MKSIEILSIVAVSLFLLLGLFLIGASRARQKGFGWLGLFFFLLGINFLDALLLLNGVYYDFPGLLFWEDPCALLYGPLIYSFSLHLKGQPPSRLPYYFVHFVPFLLLEALVMIYHLQTPASATQELLSRILESPPQLFVLFSLLPVFAHVLIYLFLARNRLQEQVSQLKHYYSQEELRWAFLLLNMILVVFLLSLCVTLIQYLGIRQYFSIALLPLLVITIILNFRLLLFAMRQPLFTISRGREAPLEISEEEEEQLQASIEQLLREERLYTDPKLSIKDLSQRVKGSERAVSQVINDRMADNFYDLINTYRIEAAKHVLQSSEKPQPTILEILYEIGFNSKSSFNTQFKKRTGMTPTAFRKAHQK